MHPPQCLSLILLLAASRVGAASSADLPVEAFFGRFDFDQMSISEDGKFLVSIVPYKGRHNLASIELANNKSRLLTTVYQGEVYDYEWVNEERLIFRVKEDGFDTGGLYAVNRDGSQPLKLSPSIPEQ